MIASPPALRLDHSTPSAYPAASAGRVYRACEGQRGPLPIGVDAHGGPATLSRRRAALSGLIACLALGCAALHSDNRAPTPEQRAQRQQWSEAAQQAIDQGDLATARAWLEQLLAEAPRSAEAQHRLGRVQEAQGDLSAAEASYQRTLELDPDYPDALCALGQLEARSGRLEPALRHIQAAIELNPRRAEAHLAEGQVLEALGRTSEALAAYFRALRYDPMQTLAMRSAATIQLAQNQPDQALARLNRALELAPEDAEARLARGRAFLELGQIPEAVTDLQQTVAELPNRPDAYYYLALVQERAENADAARDAAEHALRLAPTDTALRALSDRLRR